MTITIRTRQRCELVGAAGYLLKHQRRGARRLNATSVQKLRRSLQTYIVDSRLLQGLDDTNNLLMPVCGVVQIKRSVERIAGLGRRGWHI